MYDVLDVAKYVLYYARNHDYGMSVLQLMKILYFVQAQFLVSKKKRAFPDDIVALDWGPMERKVWAKYGVYGNANIPVLLGANFAEEEKIYTNVVAKIYAEDAWLIGVIVDLLLGYNNTVLLDVIRKQTPFKNARKNFPGFEISDKDMVDFFS